jgi:hypothetical protein
MEFKKRLDQVDGLYNEIYDLRQRGDDAGNEEVMLAEVHLDNDWRDLYAFTDLRFSGGDLQRGAEGTAGDIGHIPVPRGEGVQCTCGNTGCVEAIASGPAVAATLQSAGIRASTSSDVIELVRPATFKLFKPFVRQAATSALCLTPPSASSIPL